MAAFEKDASVLVAGGATGHGEDLLVASRALRDHAPDSHRVFLSLVTIPSTMEAYKFLASNLKIPSHRFISMADIFIDRKRDAESWELERLLLVDSEDSLPSVGKRRLQALSSPDGLIDDAFLDSSTGPLKLRNNFAFWSAEAKCNTACQPDVFLAISLILENMRSNEDVDPKRRLINSPQTHSVISAGTFARFNDGIIQVSVVRVFGSSGCIT